MAFRIHDSVVRGEIDNRVKGIVRGQIWVEGRAQPVQLELTGNAWPDLAGCLLTFRNPLARIAHEHLDTLAPLQRGSIGDLTASRKVRVFDIPLTDALEMCHRDEKPPEHMANSIYLEWFSQANGRVVIESADYEVTLSTPEWRLTPEEDTQRAEQAASGMVDFMKRLTEAVETQKRGQKDPDDEWDEHDYEKFLKECDARTDKYAELLDKYGDSEDADAKIAKEMGWDKTHDEAGGDRMSTEEMDAALDAAENEPPQEPDPNREGIDWVRDEHGHIHHPLQRRCSDCAMKYWHDADALGLLNTPDRDLAQFISEFQTTGAKLAGALDDLACGGGFADPAFTVAYLKRALDHLHKAQRGLEAAAPKKLLPDAVVVEARQDLFEIREALLRLMDDFRGR